MSYIFMKALETAPERYDTGLKLLSFMGGASYLRNEIAHIALGENGHGMHVLEIGCGTADQSIALAKNGATVVAIDHSEGMLAIARRKIKECGLEESIELRQMGVCDLDQLNDVFDAVVSCLCFSELYEPEKCFAMREIDRLVKNGGTITVADEIVPSLLHQRLFYHMISTSLSFITALTLQTSTKPLDFGGLFHDSRIEHDSLHQFGAFRIMRARPRAKHTACANETHSAPPLTASLVLRDTLLRILPHPVDFGFGIIKLGSPTDRSPVILTCNYALTVARVCHYLCDIDVWILVAPSSGINVWCASVGGLFNTASVVNAVKLSGINDMVSRRRMILPRLAGSGINRKAVLSQTGWVCEWGPANAKDIPDYLSHKPVPNHITFPLSSRMEMALSTILFMIALLAPLLLIAGIDMRVILTFSVHTLLVMAMWPTIPLSSGTYKVMAVTAVLAVLSPSWLDVITLVVNGVVLCWDADGMTPTMRSSLGARMWNKGKNTMVERWGGTFRLSPYGRISVDVDRCSGCKECERVCPMEICRIADKHVSLVNPEECVNCGACIFQCPHNALGLEMETEGAKSALENH